MIPFLFALLSVGPAFGSAPTTVATFAAASPDLVSLYESARTALANDNLAQAQAPAQQIIAAYAADPPLAAAAGTLASAVDLAAARTAFGELSREVASRITSGESTQKMLAYHCPMFPGYAWWFQTKAGIGNPYMGQAMPDCGQEVALKAAVKAATVAL